MRFARACCFVLGLQLAACSDSSTGARDASADLVASTGPNVDFAGGGGDLAIIKQDLSYPPPSSGDNTVPVTMENFDSLGTFDFPFVSVTLCVPGTTTCQTLD